MRLSLALAAAAAAVLAAGAAQAADTLSCRGQAQVMPDQSTTPIELQLIVDGGLEAPTTITYAWARPEAPVPMALQGLSGDVLSFHGLAPSSAGDGVLVADVRLNRVTLALELKVRRMGGNDEDITLTSSCRKS